MKALTLYYTLMSNVNISPHLILTPKQKEQLRSIPISKFTDKKWESQNDAAPFLSEHNLTLENNPERKWKVRYSDNVKGIRLLQCRYGSDMTLRQKNSKTKIRKSRQMYKFVGCLAFARIKKFRNKSIRIFGYLNHSEDCLCQDPYFNGYRTFYYKFYKSIMDKEFPNLSAQEKTIIAGKMWKYLPKNLKNSFEIYAINNNLLKSITQLKSSDYFKIIYFLHLFFFLNFIYCYAIIIINL
jgi:hypothetical protein